MCHLDGYWYWSWWSNGWRGCWSKWTWKQRRQWPRKRNKQKQKKNNNLEKQTQEEQKKYSSKKQCFIPLCYCTPIKWQLLNTRFLLLRAWVKYYISPNWTFLKFQGIIEIVPLSFHYPKWDIPTAFIHLAGLVFTLKSWLKHVHLSCERNQ